MYVISLSVILILIIIFPFLSFLFSFSYFSLLNRQNRNTYTEFNECCQHMVYGEETWYQVLFRSEWRGTKPSLSSSISNCILHYIILYSTILYHITIYYVASHYIILCCILSYCILYHIILFTILYKNNKKSTILHRTSPFHYSHYFSTSNSLQFDRTLLYQLRDLNCAHWLM